MSPEEAHQKALRRIEQARAETAWLLDLGNLPLAELPEKLGSLTSLNTLNLSGTGVSDRGAQQDYEIRQMNHKWSEGGWLEYRRAA